MCRNIRTLFNFEPPATDDEIRASALQFVRKLSGFNVPSKANEDRAARAVEFDREAYRRRSIVECVIGWLKECRRVMTRFEKSAKNFGGMIKVAFIQRYLRLICR